MAAVSGSKLQAEGEEQDHRLPLEADELSGWNLIEPGLSEAVDTGVQ
jgi:hypothetical protein